jgi:hypothetical protein
MLVDMVGSETPNIVEIGFKSPVTSRLGWRSVTMAKPVASKVWLIQGGHVIGKDVGIPILYSLVASLNCIQFRGFGARTNQMSVYTIQG